MPDFLLSSQSVLETKSDAVTLGDLRPLSIEERLRVLQDRHGILTSIDEHLEHARRLARPAVIDSTPEDVLRALAWSIAPVPGEQAMEATMDRWTAYFADDVLFEFVWQRLTTWRRRGSESATTSWLTELILDLSCRHWRLDVSGRIVEVPRDRVAEVQRVVMSRHRTYLMRLAARIVGAHRAEAVELELWSIVFERAWADPHRAAHLASTEDESDAHDSNERIERSVVQPFLGLCALSTQLYYIVLELSAAAFARGDVPRPGDDAQDTSDSTPRRTAARLGRQRSYEHRRQQLLASDDGDRAARLDQERLVSTAFADCLDANRPLMSAAAAAWLDVTTRDWGPLITRRAIGDQFGYEQTSSRIFHEIDKARALLRDCLLGKGVTL